MHLLAVLRSKHILEGLTDARSPQSCRPAGIQGSQLEERLKAISCGVIPCRDWAVVLYSWWPRLTD